MPDITVTPIDVSFDGERKLTDEGIARAAYNAGLRGAALRTAIAVALAESGGDSHAHAVGANVGGEEATWGNVSRSPSPGESSLGLWQINIGQGANNYDQVVSQNTRNRWRNIGPKALLAWDVNAEAMVAISRNGTNWTPWTTYTKGTYRQYLGRAGTAADAVEKKASSGASVDLPYTPDWVDGIVGAAGDAGEKVIDAANKVTDAASATANALGDIASSVRDFIGKLLDLSTWLRVAMVIGGALVALWAFARLTGARVPVPGL